MDVRFAGFSASEDWAKSVIIRYPVGAQIGVSVDPSNPEESVLEPGVRGHMYMYLCAGCILTALGLGLLYMTATHWRDEIAQGTNGTPMFNVDVRVAR